MFNCVNHASIQLKMFGILFRCCAFLVLDTEKVMDEKVEHSTLQSEPCAGTNSLNHVLVRTQNSVM